MTTSVIGFVPIDSMQLCAPDCARPVERRQRRYGFLTSIVLIAGRTITCALACVISRAYRLFGGRRRPWLIGERQDTARDNGYHLFAYIRAHHPECDIHYVIRKGAKDMARVSDLGNIVYHNSLRHYLFYFIADKLIGTHERRPQPDLVDVWPFCRLRDAPRRVYIKHGIIKDIVPSHHSRWFANLDLFVCGAKPEYDFVSQAYGHPPGVVRYLGLARFDALHDCTGDPKQLLLMPTWRRWFGRKTSRGPNARRRFVQSDYFHAYNDFMNDPRLDRLLRAHGIRLLFYPHHQMHEFLDDFSVPSERVVIAREDDYDIQQLLKESAMLITDYSSVAFDFAYMRKPVVYYQFDERSYYLGHYGPAYFDYVRDGFGPVVRTLDELIEQVRSAIASDVAIAACYLERADRFFPLRDKENCKRNYEAVRSL